MFSSGQWKLHGSSSLTLEISSLGKQPSRGIAPCLDKPCISNIQHLPASTETIHLTNSIHTDPFNSCTYRNCWIRNTGNHSASWSFLVFDPQTLTSLAFGRRWVPSAAYKTCAPFSRICKNHGRGLPNPHPVLVLVGGCWLLVVCRCCCCSLLTCRALATFPNVIYGPQTFEPESKAGKP